MGTAAKKTVSSANGRAIKHSSNAARSVRSQVKSNATSKVHPKKPPATIAEEYLRMFAVRPASNQNLASDSDSLEQPSELRYANSTSSPYAEV